MTQGYAIAAGHPLTAEAGAEVLAAGGSAVDAVIAGAAMAMVAEPVLAGLLGGGFLMLRGADGTVDCLDFFVDTPKVKRPLADCDLQEIEADFGGVTQRFRIGAGTVAVSGIAPGLVAAHARAGRMPLRALLEPAVAAAREGVAVTGFQARLGQIVRPILTASPAARALNADGEGVPLAEGAVRKNPDFAEVLEVFGIEGPDFVQQGEVAAALLDQMAAGGHLTRDDLTGWRAVWRRPLTQRRGRVRFALNPPPALGGALTGLPLALLPPRPGPAARLAALALTTMARRDSGIDAAPDAGAAALAGALLQSRLRAVLAGPAGAWLAEAEAAARRGRALRGTTHLSAVDPSGAAAALTLSNGEGCGLIVPGTGIMANNMLGEDDLVPAAAEGDPLGWTPGRRLSSMMAPMVASWDDGRVAVLGSGGSNRIRTALAEVGWRLADETPEGRLPDLEAAVVAPRMHVEGVGEAAVLDYERTGLSEADETALRRAWPEACARPRGWDAPSMFFGGVHAVARDPAGQVVAAGDPRRAGAAAVG
ncbi:MAG: gamma-glutamyltransferase [Pseudomonadota bacterium]